MENNNNGKGKTVNVASLIVILIVLGVLIVFGAFGMMIAGSVKKEIEGGIDIDTSAYDTSVTAVITENRKISVSVGEGMDANPADSYTPVYRYDYNGTSYTVSGSASSGTPRYAVGEKVNVRISSDDPEKMYDPDFNAKTVYNSFKKDVKRMLIIPSVISVVMIMSALVCVILFVRKHGSDTGSTFYGSTQSSEQENYDPNDDYRG